MKIEDKIFVWTDGSLTRHRSNNKTYKLGGWAAHTKHPSFTHQISGRALDVTSPCMEITAAVKALEAITEARKTQTLPSKVVIFSDMTYLVNSRTRWLGKRMAANWKKGGKDVRNAKLFRQLDKLQENLQVEWEWIPSHSKFWENELADWLAKLAARKGIDLTIVDELKRIKAPKLSECSRTDLHQYIATNAIKLKSIKEATSEYADPVLRTDDLKRKRKTVRNARHKLNNKLNRKRKMYRRSKAPAAPAMSRVGAM